MGLFSAIGDLFMPPAPVCDDCDETMESGETWDPRLGQAVSSWDCPSCDKSVMRDDGDGVQQYDSPVGSMDRGGSGDREDSGLSTGVLPLDGDGYDDDDGWRDASPRRGR